MADANTTTHSPEAPVPRRSYRRGFTLIEIIVTLGGIVAILAALGPLLLRPPSARVCANDVAFAVLQARFEAIKRDAAIAVVRDAATERVESRLTDETTTSCGTGSSLLRTHDARAYGNVAITTNLGGSGVLWFPKGTILTCDGMPILGSFTVRDARSTYGQPRRERANLTPSRVASNASSRYGRPPPTSCAVGSSRSTPRPTRRCFQTGPARQCLAPGYATGSTVP